MSPLLNIAIVALGGALGSSLRYSVELIDIIATQKGLGTILVNVLGCFIIGISYSLFANLNCTQQWRLLLMVGILGGFTTFSTYALDFVSMLKDGETIKAIAYILATNILGILAVVLGIYLMNLIFKLWAQ